MAWPQNVFQQTRWATTYFLQFREGHESNTLICFVTKKAKQQYLLCDMILIDVLDFE